MKSKDATRYYRKIDKVSDAKEGELVFITGKIKEIAVKLSPKITFPQEFEGEIYDTGFSGNILDIDFEIRDGYLIKKTTGKKSFSEHAEEFNRIISVFNILGLPFDFVTVADITLFSEDSVEQPFIAPLSSKAYRRGKVLDTVEVNPNETTVLYLALYIFREAMKKNKINELADICKFFGYAQYYFFHNDYHLTFVNSWMFIEPVVNHLFNEAITGKNKNPKYSPLKKVRNWSMEKKINELFKLGKINPDTRDKLQKLRYKRNKVFHVDKDIHKRKVEFNHAWDCLKMTMILFYKLLGVEEGNILFFKEIDEIRNKIGMAIFGPSFRYQPKLIKTKQK